MSHLDPTLPCATPQKEPITFQCGEDKVLSREAGEVVFCLLYAVLSVCFFNLGSASSLESSPAGLYFITIKIVDPNFRK